MGFYNVFVPWDDADAETEECDCHTPTRSCAKHGSHICPLCMERAFKGDVLFLEEHYHPACTQAWINAGEWTPDELAGFADVLAEHGITWPGASERAAAE